MSINQDIAILEPLTNLKHSDNPCADFQRELTDFISQSYRHQIDQEQVLLSLRSLVFMRKREGDSIVLELRSCISVSFSVHAETPQHSLDIVLECSGNVEASRIAKIILNDAGFGGAEIVSITERHRCPKCGRYHTLSDSVHDGVCDICRQRIEYDV